MRRRGFRPSSTPPPSIAPSPRPSARIVPDIPLPTPHAPRFLPGPPESARTPLLAAAISSARRERGARCRLGTDTRTV